MNPFWKVADFVRSLRREMRFGQLSRAPLRLLRLELLEKTVVCDWMARPAGSMGRRAFSSRSEIATNRSKL